MSLTLYVKLTSVLVYRPIVIFSLSLCLINWLQSLSMKLDGQAPYRGGSQARCWLLGVCCIFEGGGAQMGSRLS